MLTHRLLTAILLPLTTSFVLPLLSALWVSSRTFPKNSSFPLLLSHEIILATLTHHFECKQRLLFCAPALCMHSNTDFATLAYIICWLFYNSRYTICMRVRSGLVLHSIDSQCWTLAFHLVGAQQGLPRWLSAKEPTCQHMRCGFDPWLGRSPGEGNGNPL